MNAYQRGRRAACDGLTMAACPFPSWTSEGRAWLVGWRECAAFLEACAVRHSWGAVQ